MGRYSLLIYTFLFLMILVACNRKTKNVDNNILEMLPTSGSVLSDSEMVNYFETHKADFEILCTWITEDKLEFMLLNSYDTRHLNKISKERAEAYFKLMKKLGIDTLARGNVLNFNSIVFYFPPLLESENKIQKGYEYKIDTANNNRGWIKTDSELLDETRKHERNTFVYKPINEHWNLICLIQ